MANLRNWNLSCWAAGKEIDGIYLTRYDEGMATVAAIENFRGNVRAIMDDRDLSQDSLAELIDSTQAYVSRVLSGKIDPSMSQCEKISKALNVPLTALLSEPSDFLKIRA